MGRTGGRAAAVYASDVGCFEIGTGELLCQIASDLSFALGIDDQPDAGEKAG